MKPKDVAMVSYEAWRMYEKTQGRHNNPRWNALLKKERDGVEYDVKNVIEGNAPITENSTLARLIVLVVRFFIYQIGGGK